MVQWGLEQQLDAKQESMKRLLHQIRGIVETAKVARTKVEDALERYQGPVATSGGAIATSAAATVSPVAFTPHGAAAATAAEAASTPRLMSPPRSPIPAQSPPQHQLMDLLAQAAATERRDESAHAQPQAKKAKVKAEVKVKAPWPPALHPQLAAFMKEYRKFLETEHLSSHTKRGLTPSTVKNRMDHVSR